MALSDLFRRKPKPITDPRMIDRAMSRAFAAAQLTRLTDSWRATQADIVEELRGDLDRLRERARNLENDNDFALRYLEMCETNIVGDTGPRLVSLVENRPGESDQMAREAIEAAWARFCKRGVCEVSGNYSMIELMWNIVRSTPRDGEFLLFEEYGRNAGNEFDYALRVVDVETIATWHNRPKAAGVNAIKLGVELDSMGRTVAIWFTNGSAGARTATRVDATNIIHRFKSRRSGQTRGIPWMHAAMLSMHFAGEFALSALLAAKQGADHLGFFVTEDGQAPQMPGDEQADGSKFSTSAPGTWDTLPAGTTVTSVDSKYPNEVFDPFMKSAHRRMASGLNVSYPALCNDHADLNYNSIRATQNDDRDQWRRHQRWFEEAWLEVLFSHWLTAALGRGAIKLPNGSPLPIQKADKFAAHAWQHRGWQSNDPLKEINAASAAFKEGVDSRTAWAARNGRDIEDVFSELENEARLAAKRNITLGDAVAAVPDPVDPPAA
ncbi:MAG: phage portal protein [Nevskia sp.]|jgi:lambda family phage portal protein|nr:phage portal protein [Nevskia sp.]